MLKIIVITRPDFFEGEMLLVNRLFSEGMERLHLRKPKATEQELAAWIEQVEPSFRQRIVLHDHHALANAYSLGGIHLNSRNPEPPQWVGEAKASRPFTVSRSCHSIEEVRTYKGLCDYLFLSPIYDSISKEGYGAAFSREALESARQEGLLQDNVYALGGIAPDKLAEVEQFGFAGAAMLGAVWGNPYCKIGNVTGGYSK